MTDTDNRCRSGVHVWIDSDDRCRCCNGYVRVQDTSREALVAIGAECIVYRGMWRGWLRVIKTTVCCSWCHAACEVRKEEKATCPDCGHRADVSRLACDCKRCRP